MRFLRRTCQWKPSWCQIWVIWNYRWCFLLCVIHNVALSSVVRCLLFFAGRCTGFGETTMWLDPESQLWKTVHEEMRCLVFLLSVLHLCLSLFCFFYSSLSFTHSCTFLFFLGSAQRLLIPLAQQTHKLSIRDLGALCNFAHHIYNFSKKLHPVLFSNYSLTVLQCVYMSTESCFRYLKLSYLLEFSRKPHLSRPCWIKCGWARSRLCFITLLFAFHAYVYVWILRCYCVIHCFYMHRQIRFGNWC